MALTDEQRSLLQLLLQGQSYEDIGSLLGEEPGHVRGRARAALTEIGGADPDARVGLSDFLLGQADPIGRADAVRQLQNDPEANFLAQTLVAQLRLLSPQAQLPDVPPMRGGRGARAPGAHPGPAAPGSTPSAPPTGQGGEGPLARVRAALRGLGGGDPRRSKALVAIGLLAILVIAVVLVVLLAGGDGDGDGDGGETGTETTAASDELTIVQLAPLQEGGEASGQAVFAQAGDQPLLQINLVGLRPAGKGQTYIVWLYSSDRAAFPLARDQVAENGALTGAAAVPQAVVPLLGQFGCVDVSLASNAETRKALQQAVDGQSLPAHSGESVLRGEIPASAGEQAASGAASQCDRAAAQPQGDQ
ncbi:MAG: hypothetical protein ACXWZW_08080 [Solirubrobacterales bacterium]